MKRFVLGGALALCFALGAAGAQENVTIWGLKGPSGVGLARLFDQPPSVPGYAFKVETLASADLMVAKLVSGEAKLGVLPPNVAAKLAAAGRPLSVAAVTGDGMLALLTSDPAVQSLADLRGKSVQASGQGAVPEFVFRKILAKAGLAPDVDVALNFSMAYPEIAQALIAGKIATALLPEPFATMARLGRRDLREPVDVQAEWAAAGGSATYPMTVFVVDRGWAAANRSALAAVLDAYRASIAWVAANPAAAGEAAEAHDLGLKAAVAAAAVPRSAYVFVPAGEARPALEAEFSSFLEYAPASIGGKLPDAAFYLQP
jgi:NitT/TauT family transport system substrate-binding protein